MTVAVVGERVKALAADWILTLTVTLALALEVVVIMRWMGVWSQSALVLVLAYVRVQVTVDLQQAMAICCAAKKRIDHLEASACAPMQHSHSYSRGGSDDKARHHGHHYCYY